MSTWERSCKLFFLSKASEQKTPSVIKSQRARVPPGRDWRFPPLFPYALMQRYKELPRNGAGAWSNRSLHHPGRVHRETQEGDHLRSGAVLWLLVDFPGQYPCRYSHPDWAQAV